MYKLKSNAADFTVVDGKFAGRTYRAGETYEDIPPEEKNKFEKITVIKVEFSSPSFFDARLNASKFMIKMEREDAAKTEGTKDHSSQ